MAQSQVPAVQGQMKPVELLKSYLNAPSVQDQFKNALGAHKDAFVASLIDLFTGDQSLQSCKPASLITEALRAATLKLPLNKALGFAYIVVYKNSVKNADGSWAKVPTPTFIPGYKGYIQLAMRTGQYRTINADVVYEGELRRVDKLTGEIAFDGEKVSDKVVGYFCYFELLNGFKKTLFMNVEEMAAYAKRYSKSVGRDTSAEQLRDRANDGKVSTKVGWEGNFNDMAIKTVVRRLLSKYGYLSVEMQGVMDKDLGADAQAERDESVRGFANAKTIDATEVEYEKVDTETGEVKGAEGAPVGTATAEDPAEASPAGADEEPEY